ncbi:MAG: pre-peptidase C-terminal domain-containing protein, partial [Victivallaceae bacterium]
NLDVDTTAPAVPKSLIQVVSGNNVTFDWSDSTDARAGLKQYEVQVDNNNDFSSPENTLTPAVSSADLSGMADGSYFWRVRALDNAGNWSNWSSSSSFSVDITAPSIPGGLTQTTNVGDVALDWNDSSDNTSGVKQYEVQVDNNNDFSSPENTVTSGTSNANLSNMADGSYFWRVRTQDNFGNWSSWSATSSFDIDLVQPTVPLNLTHSVSGANVSMDWDDSTDARSGVKQYQVQVDNNSDFSSPEKAAASLTSKFSATGLAEGIYFWRVRAEDNNGNWSAWSANGSFIVDTSAPTIPDGMTRTVTGSNVALDWNDAFDTLAGVKLYQVQLDNNNAFSSPEYSAAPTGSAADFSSVSDGNYFWRVRTQDNNGNWSNWSAADSLAVDTTGPAVPVNLTRSITGGSVALDWNDAKDAISGLKQYEVQVDTHEDFSSPLKTITSGSSAANVDSLVDGKYFWRVRAQDNFGNWSNWSVKSSFSIYIPDFVPPTVPVSLKSSMAANSLLLSWSNSTDERGIKRYQVQIDNNNDFSSPTLSTLSETNSSEISGLAEGSYFWRVRAQDNSGNWSEWSSTAGLTASFDLLPPSIPTGLKQTIAADTAALDWNDSKDAKSGIKNYEIQIDNNAGFSSPEKTATTAISMATVSGLAAGSYFWRVRAVDNAGHPSNWSKASSLLITPKDTIANDWKTAKSITDGVGHCVGTGDAADCYKLIMTNAGTLTLGLTGLTGNATLSLLDSKGKTLKTSANKGTASEAITDFALLSGTYYVKVAPADARTSSEYTLTHSIKYTPVDKAANTWQTAKNIADGVDNWAGFGDAADFYKVSMAAAGTLALNLTGLTGDANLSLLDSNGRVLKTSVNRASKDEAITANLFSGTYYVKVAPSTGVNNAPYTLTSVKKDCPADTAGNSFETALKVTTNGTTAEWLGFSDKADYYKFDLQTATNAQFNLSGLKSNVNLYLYDGKKRQIAASANAGNSNESIIKNLAAGTYYVAAKLTGKDNTDYSLAFNIDPAAFKAGSLKMFGSSSPLTSGSDSALSADPLKKNQGMLAS